MRTKLNKFMALILVGIMVLTLLGGCAVQRKPLPPDANRPPAPNNTPDANPNANPNVQPRTPEEARDTAITIQNRVRSVEGVRNAHVVVMGNVALVGLNIQEARQEEGADRVKADATRTAETDARIVKAYVTADPDMVARIQEISEGIRQGRPITEFLDEISEMLRRLAPSGRRAPVSPQL